MDEKGIEAKGTAPLSPWFEGVDALKDKKQLTPELIRLHISLIGAMFSTGSGQDFKNAENVIAQLDQGGLGLPERDYYFKDDPKSVELAKLTSRTSRACSSCSETMPKSLRRRPLPS